MKYKHEKYSQLFAKVSTEKYDQSINLIIYFLVKGKPVSPKKYGKNRITSPGNPMLLSEGLTLMTIESGYINCAMSPSEVRELRKSILLCTDVTSL